jgi:hypothetical protein
VNTPRERFEEYMAWLHREGYKVIALRDLATWVDPSQAPANALEIMKRRQQARAAALANPASSTPSK